MSILNFLLRLSRTQKKIILLIHDALMIFCAFWLSFSLRLDIASVWHVKGNWLLYGITTFFSIAAFVRLGLYRAVLRYAGTRILNTVLIGSVVSVCVLMAASFFTHLPLPRTVPVMYFLLLLVLMTGSRFTVKGLLSSSKRYQSTPVIIYGAGESGRQLLEAVKQVDQYYPVAFVDDNTDLQGSIIHNLTVFPPQKLATLIERYNAEKILLAIPSASQQQKQKIIHSLESLPCEVLSIPGMRDLVEGKITVSSLKKISIADLLGRDAVDPNPSLLAANITDQVVLVTGAGGSIGSELCRQIIQNRPIALILFEVSEFALYTIFKELEESVKKNQLSVKLYPILGSVMQRNDLYEVMHSFRVNTVYHAAAYKHVPLVEFNTSAGVCNNVFGTLHCAQAAIDAGVETFVLISTDKAVRPTNTMGASKRMAELVLQALANETPRTCFSMVRFGNVLGSSGSVIPLFEKQIADGGPVTLTHPEITRFFMTIPEAAQLVIQAGAMGQGGDVFVLDMGESIKIMDLARRMIRLSGLNVKNDTGQEGDIEIQITGLRPGEKLYEEVLIGEDVSGTEHPRIMTAQEIMLPWAELSVILEALRTTCVNKNADEVRSLLLAAPLAFTPKDEVCDLLWQQKENKHRY